MARSKIKGTSGKPVAKAKKKSTNRASVQIHQRKDGDYDVTRRDDGDPTITSTFRDRRKTVPGKPKVTTKHVDTGRESNASRLADKAWKKKQKASDYSCTDGKPCRYPERGKKGRPAKKNSTSAQTTKTPTKKPNPKYNKKGEAQKDYSDKAKRPGGHILGIPKTEKMTPSQRSDYYKYLKSK